MHLIFFYVNIKFGKLFFTRKGCKFFLYYQSQMVEKSVKIIINRGNFIIIVKFLLFKIFFKKKKYMQDRWPPGYLQPDLVVPWPGIQIWPRYRGGQPRAQAWLGVIGLYFLKKLNKKYFKILQTIYNIILIFILNFLAVQ